MSREPAAILGAVGSLVAAVLALLVAFGVELTDEQRETILAVVAAAGPLVTALFIRRKVSPAHEPEHLA